MKVSDMGKDFKFISQAQEVEAINEEYGEDHDSYFIEQAKSADIFKDWRGCNVIRLQVFGMYGTVPSLDKEVYKVV